MDCPVLPCPVPCDPNAVARASPKSHALTIIIIFTAAAGEIDQLLNWGPISFVLAVPFCSFMLARKNGLQRSMRLAAVLCAAACVIRLIPCFMSAATRRGHWAGRLPLHIAQILNGIAGPVSYGHASASFSPACDHPQTPTTCIGGSADV